MTNVNNSIKLTNDCDSSTFSLSVEAKANWLSALRSGEYRQVRGSMSRMLHGRDAHPCRGYCAVGLLAKTLGVHDNDLADSGSCVLPLRLSEFKVAASTLFANKTALVDLNDEEKLSFNELADIIERSVPCHDD